MRPTARYSKQAARELAGPLLALGTTVLSTLLLWHNHAHDEKILQTAKERLRSIKLQKAEFGLPSPANASEKEPPPPLPAEFARLAAISEPQARAAWRMQLANAQQQTEIIQLRYTLAARQKRSEHTPGNSLALYSSQMQLEMELAHEADFLAFLESLLTTPAALPILRECELNQPIQSSPTATQRLQARCLIDWLTLDQPERAMREQ